MIHATTLKILAGGVILEGEIFHKGIEIANLVVGDAYFALDGMNVSHRNIKIDADRLFPTGERAVLGMRPKKDQKGNSEKDGRGYEDFPIHGEPQDDLPGIACVTVTSKYCDRAFGPGVEIECRFGEGGNYVGAWKCRKATNKDH